MSADLDDDVIGVAAKLYAALPGGDRATLNELLAEDFVGETTAGLPLELGGRYQGSCSMRRDFWGAIGRHYDIVAEPLRYDLLGDERVLVNGLYRGSARARQEVRSCRCRLNTDSEDVGEARSGRPDSNTD